MSCEKSETDSDTCLEVVTALPKKHHSLSASSIYYDPQRETAAKEHTQEKFGERNVDNRLQVQLKKNGGGSTRHLDG